MKIKYLTLLVCIFFVGCNNPLVDNSLLSGCYGNCIKKTIELAGMSKPSPMNIERGATESVSFTFLKKGGELVSCSFAINSSNVSGSNYSVSVNKVGDSCNMNIVTNSGALGVINLVLKATDNEGNDQFHNYTVNVYDRTPVVTTYVNNVDSKVGTSVYETLLTDESITNCTISPALPPGLILNILSTGCQIAGTPTSIQTSGSYEVTAHNNTASVSQNFTISVYDFACENTLYSSAIDPRLSPDRSKRIVCNENQLLNISNNLLGEYELGANIDLSSVGVTTSMISGSFLGNFNGNGYKLTGLRMPLFNTVSGNISNLTLEDFSVDSSNAGFITKTLSATGSVNDILVVGSLSQITDTATSSVNISAIAGVVDTTASISRVIIKNLLNPSTLARCVAGGVSSYNITNLYVKSTDADCVNTSSNAGSVNTYTLESELPINFGGIWTNDGSNQVLISQQVKIYQ